MTQTIRNDLNRGSFNEPILHGLTEVEFVKDILSTEAFNPGSQQPLQGFETRILKRHLRKVIIDYTLKFKDSTRNYIGLYRESDERLGHTFSVMKTLRSNGFGQESNLRVPSPVLYIPTLSFLMMEQAEGQPLREIFESRMDSGPHVKGAARWLAKLHNSNVRLDGEFFRDDEMEPPRNFGRPGRWLLPPLNFDINSISNTLIDGRKPFPLTRGKPIHGDYNPRT